MLSDIEPGMQLLDVRQEETHEPPISGKGFFAPEVQVVHRSLLISHKDVEGKQVDWRKCPSAQHFEQCWKPIPIQVGNRRRRVVPHSGRFAIVNPRCFDMGMMMSACFKSQWRVVVEAHNDLTMFSRGGDKALSIDGDS